MAVPLDCFNLNSVVPDEIQRYAAFNLGLHCLSNITRLEVSSIQNVNLPN